MSRSRDAGRKWLRLAGVLVVSLVAVGVGYDIASSPPTYVESATVMFSLPKSEISPHAYFILAAPLITSSQAMTQLLMSPRSQRQIREAGGTAKVNLALVNLYSDQYPDYGVPLATLTAESPSAANAHRTFAIAVRRLDRLLAGRQEKIGITPRNRISAQILADTGPMLKPGSLKRVFAGLVILALVAVAGLWSFIDRRVRQRT